MSDDPHFGGWVHPGGSEEEIDAHIERAIADFLSHPPTRCTRCMQPARRAVFVRGIGAFKYETGILPVCDDHDFGLSEGTCASVVDGAWVRE